MTSYHLMLEEDIPLCGNHNAALTYRDDVADCPDCWRKLTTKLRDERNNMEKMKNALAQQLLVAAEKGILAEKRVKLLEEVLSAFPGLNSDTEDVIKWIYKKDKVIG